MKNIYEKNELLRLLPSHAPASPKEVGLRHMEMDDIYEFSEWEKNERPYPWTPKNFEETIYSRTQHGLVWEDKNMIMGFAVLQLVGPESYLLNIMVDPKKRGVGLGEKLLDKVLSYAKKSGAQHMFLDVDTNNVSALRLYDKAGFLSLNHRFHAYPSGEDAILMTKTL